MNFDLSKLDKLAKAGPAKPKFAPRLPGKQASPKPWGAVDKSVHGRGSG